MLATTLALGAWQVRRLEWKQGMLADIERGESSAPVPLGPDPAPFRRVVATGRYLPGVARYGAEVRSGAGGPTMGSHVIIGLEQSSGGTVMVDRGWAPDDTSSAGPSGLVQVQGYVRPPEYPVRFGAKDDAAARRFFALDPAAIGASLGIEKVAPFTLVALGAPGVVPEPASALPRPANNHLSYALTWFGLAAALVVVFAIYVRQTLAQETRHDSV